MGAVVARGRREAKGYGGRRGTEWAAAGAARPGRTDRQSWAPLRSAGGETAPRERLYLSLDWGKWRGERLFPRVTEKLQKQIHVSFAKDYVYKRLKIFRTPP